VTAETRPAIRRRRITFLTLNLLTLAALVAAMLRLILDGGGTATEWIIGLGFLVTIPYTVIGFWNALIGLWLLHACPGTVDAMPGVADLRAREAPRLNTRVAILLAIRHENPAPVFERLGRMRASLEATGQLPRFTFAVLSDSSRADAIAAEQAAFARFLAGRLADEPEPIYRRRADNHGYKAGNIREFLDTRGDAFDYFIPLDADSLIAGPVMVRLVATMEAHADIGILQSLVVGMPSASGFTRVFQFGMRHGMRTFTTGAAWWTADCGPYWGHNAVVRLKPFREHCRLPDLPGKPPLGGAVLSHDQLEATFMRRAGYEVRVIPVESESYEINPPTLLDFIRRELRWCQGNMQYVRCVATPGLKPVSRLQLFIAIGMYLGQGAWIAMIAAACIGSMVGDFRVRDVQLGITLFVGIFFLAIAPKLLGVLDVALTHGGARRYGGAGKFGLSALLELLSSMLMAPVVALSICTFLIGLPFGQSVTWGTQNRAAVRVRWRDAVRALAPHTLLGLALAAALWHVGGWIAAAWALPIIAGLTLAIPYTVWSARTSATSRVRVRLFAIPEEKATPKILAPRRAPTVSAAPRP
jgi:membrane glycosyltransferase